LGTRSNAILPVIPGDKIAAGVTDDRYLQFPDQRKGILAEAVIIRFRMSRLVNALINGPAQMFDKRTVDTPVYLTDPKILVDYNLSFFHFSHLFFGNSFESYRFSFCSFSLFDLFGYFDLFDYSPAYPLFD
jgi:hypothetical protein